MNNRPDTRISGNLRASDKEFEFYAARTYQNRQCMSIEEFYSDLARFTYIKKLLNRYMVNSEDFHERLILNHLIAIYNVWPIDAANRMVFARIDEKSWPALKTILLFLGYIPEKGIYEDISVDIKVAKILQNI